MEQPEQPTNPNEISDEEVEHRMAEADGVIGAAGHTLGYVPASMQEGN